MLGGGPEAGCGVLSFVSPTTSDLESIRLMSDDVAFASDRPYPVTRLTVDSDVTSPFIAVGDLSIIH